MTVTFAPRGILQIDNAHLVYKNFEGRGDKFNREGERNFSLVIPDEELRDNLVADGWNVKSKPARDGDDIPFMTLPVKVKFNDRGPNIYLVSGGRKIKLDEENVGLIDDMDIENIDLDIRPYDWEVNGKTGRTAYLQSMQVTQRLDRFAERFAEEEYPEE